MTLMRARLVLLLVGGLLVPGPVASARMVQSFPASFRWGTAISAFQSGMGVGAPADPTTDWWVWVHDAANIASGRVSGDLPESGPGFYDLFDRDAAVARKGLGNDALRLGIEWSRIFPTSTAGIDISGGFTPAVLAALDAIADPVEVAHYRDVFATLRHRGVEPMGPGTTSACRSDCTSRLPSATPSRR
jgi:beta-galactosidase